jgi:hypothetical protein
MDETLAVVPAGLLTASQLITDQATALHVPCGHPGRPAEPAGAAAAGLYRVFDDYRAGFARRLSAVSDRLVRAAGDYTRLDSANGAVLTAVAPARQR